MAGSYHAPVFNQPQSMFEFTAQGAAYAGPRTLSNLSHPIEVHAPSLEGYIGHYVEDVVQPLSDGLVVNGVVVDRNKLSSRFTVGAYMTYEMIRNVYMDTGAELPPLSYGLPSTRMPRGGPRTDEADIPLIDVYYRGAELRDSMPHVYAASLVLLKEAVGEPAAQAEIDLDTPLDQHGDPQLAWEELHFIGGAAEAALIIEERAAAV